MYETSNCHTNFTSASWHFLQTMGTSILLTVTGQVERSNTWNTIHMATNDFWRIIVVIFELNMCSIDPKITWYLKQSTNHFPGTYRTFSYLFKTSCFLIDKQTEYMCYHETVLTGTDIAN